MSPTEHGSPPGSPQFGSGYSTVGPPHGSPPGSAQSFSMTSHSAGASVGGMAGAAMGYNGLAPLYNTKKGEKDR